MLADDGVLALLWNLPDTRQPWLKDLYAITHPGQDPLRDMQPIPLTGFRPGTMAHTPWQQQLAPAEVVDLVSTYSRIATSPPAQRDALLDAVREVVTTHPDVVGATEIDLPYVCIAFHYRMA